MPKVYLLLRNNKQNGPYSLEELVQLGLKPYDLVWVEGKSAGWRYPGEIDALKPYVAAPPQPSPGKVLNENGPDTSLSNGSSGPSAGAAPVRASGKHIYVSMPGKGQDIAQRTDLPRSASVSADRPENIEKTVSPAQNAKEEATSAPQPRYSKTLQEMEEEYTNWVYKTRTKKKHSLVQRQIMAVVGMAVLVVGFYFGASRLMASRGDREPAVVTAKVVNGYPEATENKVIPASETAQTAVPLPTSNSADTLRSLNTNSSIRKESMINAGQRAKEHQQPGPKMSGVQKNIQASTSTSKPETPVQTKEVPPVAEKPVLKSPDEHQPAVKPKEAPAEKKKGGFLAGLFSKLKHKKDEAPDNTTQAPVPPAGTANSGNERKAVHRGDETNSQSSPSETGTTTAATTAAPALAEKLEITSNERSEDWMMGVNGLKLTVHNKNNVPIKKATVEVLYYDENNHLLDKKAVYFNNIPPKGNATVQAPQERFADHVDYRIASVSSL